MDCHPHSEDVNVMDWLPVQDVFLLHVQCSQDKLWSHNNPTQDKALTEHKLLDNPP